MALIASHIVTCFLASSGDNSVVSSSTISCGLASFSDSEFSVSKLSTSVFSTTHVLSNISESPVFAITSHVHSKIYIADVSIGPDSSFLNKSFTYSATLSDHHNGKRLNDLSSCCIV
jgi:hypothetical protein